MKNIGKIIGASAIVVLFLFGTSGVSACQLHTELIAGQTTGVGDVFVKHPGSTNRYMYITYSITADGWEITETNLAVAESFDGIPQNKKGNPKIGHFPYSSEHDPGVASVTHTIDLNNYIQPDADGKYLGTLYIAAHAVVQELVRYDSEGNPIYGDSETGWADTRGQPFPGGSWALWFTIELD